jgi:DNA-binding transcriptional LysR family regulator
MNWDDLRIFLEVARAGQILGAGRRLGLNHATVARRINALEAALGTKLLRRHTGGTELTREGERFLALAERVEAETIAARAEVAEQAAGVSGTVRIGAPDGFGVSFLAPRLGGLGAQHPDLTIQLVPVPRSFSLSRREADIAITVERPSEGRLVAAKLTDYTLRLYCSKPYAARHGLPAHIEELSGHRLVGYVDDLVANPSLDYAAEIWPEWKARFAVSSALGQVAAVRAGAGIGILHSFIARQDETLVALDIAPPIRRNYWLVYHESMRAVRRIAVVAAFIADAVQKERAAFNDEAGG